MITGMVLDHAVLISATFLFYLCLIFLWLVFLRESFVNQLFTIPGVPLEIHSFVLKPIIFIKVRNYSCLQLCKNLPHSSKIVLFFFFFEVDPFLISLVDRVCVSSGHIRESFTFEESEDTECLFRYSANLFQKLLVLKRMSQLDNVITNN